MTTVNVELEFEKIYNRISQQEKKTEEILKILGELRVNDSRQRDMYVSKEGLDAYTKWMIAELEKRDERLKPISTIVYGVLLSVLTSAATLVFTLIQ